MKKQIKFKNYFLISIIILIIFNGFLYNTNGSNCHLKLTNIIPQDTIKVNSQQKQIEQLIQKVDSVKLKWDAIEKAIKEKKQPN